MIFFPSFWVRLGRKRVHLHDRHSGSVRGLHGRAPVFYTWDVSGFFVSFWHMLHKNPWKHMKTCWTEALGHECWTFSGDFIGSNPCPQVSPFPRPLAVPCSWLPQVHLLHAYDNAPVSTRAARAHAALEEMGISVANSAITTLFAAAMLFACGFYFFFQPPSEKIQQVWDSWNKKWEKVRWKTCFSLQIWSGLEIWRI